MTTVIMLVLGILIAAVAALMMFFYGGSAFDSSQTKADAARLVTEGGQIESAVSLYQIQEGKLPGDGVGIDDKAMQEMIAKKYLTARPKGNVDANGQNKIWTVDYDMGIIRSTVGPTSDAHSMAVCVEARKQLRLPAAGVSGGVFKCDGTDYPGGKLSSREPCCIASNVTEASPGN